MPSAVLLSGGLDSAVLLAEEAAADVVQPIYVSVGLAWEDAERLATMRLLTSGQLSSRVKPLVSLSVDMTKMCIYRVATSCSSERLACSARRQESVVS
jgi:hypothetical protein